jgi:hypothetical protein
MKPVLSLRLLTNPSLTCWLTAVHRPRSMGTTPWLAALTREA